jgi:hypothetical protein
MRSRVNDMISATERMACTRRTNGQAFKAGTQEAFPSGKLGS